MRKLDKTSSFLSKVEQIAAENLILFKTNFSNTPVQRGTPPLGMRTIWIPVNDDQFNNLSYTIITLPIKLINILFMLQRDFD